MKIKTTFKKSLSSILLAAAVFGGVLGFDVISAQAATISSVSVTVPTGATQASDVTITTGADDVNLYDPNSTPAQLELRSTSGAYSSSAETGTYGGKKYTGSYTVNGFTVTSAEVNDPNGSVSILTFYGTPGGSSSSGGGSSDGSSSSSSASGSSGSDNQYTDAQRAYAAFHDHEHNGNFENFKWEEVSHASEFSNGEEVFRCPDCGYVLYSVPVSAYSYFNKTQTTKIEKASQNSTVTIDAGQWISFHKMVIDAMAKRSDVTYVINYSYNHLPYTLTIPAGTDLSNVLTGDEMFAGFLYLAKQAGTAPVAR